MRVTYGLPVPLSLSVAYVFRFRGTRPLAAWPVASRVVFACCSVRRALPTSPGHRKAIVIRCGVRRRASRATRHLRHRRRSAAVSIGTGRALLDPEACPSPVLRRHR